MLKNSSSGKTQNNNFFSILILSKRNETPPHIKKYRKSYKTQAGVKIVSNKREKIRFLNEFLFCSCIMGLLMTWALQKTIYMGKKP